MIVGESIDRSTFDVFRRIILERSGISLRPTKIALLQARVARRMRMLGLRSHRRYLRCVLRDKGGAELVHLLDAVTTNVTEFFREEAHFTFVRGAIREWMSRGQTRFRFWSAGCSSGEEPYTLGITALEAAGGAPVDVRILATDLSTQVLERAGEGVYPAKKAARVPPELLARYFRLVGDREPREYGVCDELKRITCFRWLNLSELPYPMRGPLDAVFCRNVMIYLDNELRKRILLEMHRLVKPGGYLIVGHAESLTGMISPFKRVTPSVYMKEA